MLTVTGLYKRFNLHSGFFAPEGDYVYAVNGVDFRIEPNQIYGLVGESGCGKTTVARTIIGLHTPDAGTVEYTASNGKTLNPHTRNRTEKKEIRSTLKYIFQDPAKSLNPRMNIYEVLTAGYRYTNHWPGKKQAREEAIETLVTVGLRPSDIHRRPPDFSGGQRQRIAIARALIQKPHLLICDEVVSALDVSIQSQILNLLLELRRTYQIAILFISHDLAAVGYISDRIGVMYRGMIVEENDARNFHTTHTHPYTRYLYAAVPHIPSSFEKEERHQFLDAPSTQLYNFDPTIRPESWDAISAEQDR